jgi:hypothetical protein
MSDIYKLQYAGNTLTYPGWNGYVGYDNVPSYYSLTLQTDGHGTLSATTLTGFPGDTVTLSPTYNTYYRFNNYSVTGGTISGNTFTFGNEDATAQANFKVNYFTATGSMGWSTLKGTRAGASQTKNAVLNAFTGSKPSNWPAIGGAWNVSNASAYKLNANITFNVTHEKPGYTYKAQSYAAIRIGTTNQTTGGFGATTYANTKSYTLSISNKTTQGSLNTTGSMQILSTAISTGSMAAGSNGWTATGIAP